MPYRHETAACFADAIGAHGLDRAAFDSALAGAAPALDRLRRQHGDGSLPLLHLPAARDDLAALAPHVEAFRRFADVVVLGTGGSSLGGKALVALRDVGFGPARGDPRLHFMDNIDPHSFEALFGAIDPARAGLIIISKSGGTAETLMQGIACLEHWRGAVGTAALPRHALAITEAGDNPLRRLADGLGLPVLDHDPGVGGRFSVLSIVGLLPVLIAGLDAVAVRRGAAAVLDATLAATTPGESAPAVGAALAVTLQRLRGITTCVLMPYVDRLGEFGLWYRQLWAESLGKDGTGTTPVRAMGTVDQHSQLQLYLDGPRDKMFTVIMEEMAGRGPQVPERSAESDERLAYLAGRSMGDLMDAEQRATAETLIARGCPTRILHLPRIDEERVGALMMHFMLETILAAALLEVDAFDQPAVEAGKILARQHLQAMAKT